MYITYLLGCELELVLLNQGKLCYVIQCNFYVILFLIVIFMQNTYLYSTKYKYLCANI